MTSAYQKIKDFFSHFDFLAPLGFRLYLVPVFWMAGIKKWDGIDNTIAWFANPDWGLGLPYPELLAYAATLTEILGAALLLLGFATRLATIPLMVIMVVATFTVHWDNSWAAIAASDAASSVRLQEVLTWLQTTNPDRYAYVTELGSPIMLNNGIEFAVTYFLMLLSLFFTGAGRYFSMDYWLRRRIYGK